jgi:heme/copper-type cytochrome/quinol oxidase subunit 2
MATRTPQRNPDRQADLHSGNVRRNAASDWNVFHSMREFWFWVAIVTLIIFCLVMLSFVIIHTDKQLKQVNALIIRLEEKEKKQKLLKPKEEE